MSAASAQAAAPKKKSKLPLIIGAVVLLAGGAGGGWWWTQRNAAAHAPEGEAAAATTAKAAATYFALDPAFVVNLADTDMARFLQADVQVMTRDAPTLAAIEAQAPAIRNRLLLLFGQQTAAQLGQRSGKERLQEQGLAEVRKLLREEGQPTKVEAVIFTSLVVQ
ncbi:Flagellar protein FliL [Luteimonas sp. 9C]|uniref:flagellar basal body-associated FliL family protein n=1 Tax=Luteimonas sp. 9C TaxID=2653148 RepID=UPI0012EF1F5E|nr:flagellar basal body-associated FliL family protein [Luteimonas sp. 9C]VXC08112.1 Flagellar protein FliL [Luteimonas sp. 9C]